MSTKILALTDALANLVRFVLLPGQRFDTVGVPPLFLRDEASPPRVNYFALALSTSSTRRRMLFESDL